MPKEELEQKFTSHMHLVNQIWAKMEEDIAVLKLGKRLPDSITQKDIRRCLFGHLNQHLYYGKPQVRLSARLSLPATLSLFVCVLCVPCFHALSQWLINLK